MEAAVGVEHPNVKHVNIVLIKTKNMYTTQCFGAHAGSVFVWTVK